MNEDQEVEEKPRQPSSDKQRLEGRFASEDPISLGGCSGHQTREFQGLSLFFSNI